MGYCYGFRRQCAALCAVVAVSLLAGACAFSASNSITPSQEVQPAALAKQLQGSGNKPLILQVGFETLYVQGHVPGAKYCGPARNSFGIANLKKCLKGVSHSQAIILYCGCCPWQECPNIRPAFKTVKEMGFTNVKALYIEDNFGKDWAAKGYPVATGE